MTHTGHHGFGAWPPSAPSSDLANDANLHKPGAQQASYSVDHGSRINSAPKTGLCPRGISTGQYHAVGSQPMDMAFHGDELFVPCQGDGSVHVIDIPNRRHKHSFAAGTGCESLGFF
jgi:hypothetical protein